MIKKVFLISLSVFLTYHSYHNLITLAKNPFTDSFWPAVIYSWYVSFCITGIFAFAGFALPTQKLMPETYYKIKHPKALDKYYDWLRADIFQKLLVKLFYGKQKNKKAFFNGKRSGLTQLTINTEKAEFGHLIPFIIISLIAIYTFFIEKYLFGIGLLFFNTLGNFYPIIIQRQHRARIAALKESISQGNKNG